MSMNPREPHSFAAFAAWLTLVSETSGSPFLFPKEEGEPCRNVQGVWLWLVQYEMPHHEAIETAISKLWLHEAAAFRGLPPEAAKVLRLRIETAKSLIEEFASNEESPFAYPDGAFQEAVRWLLVNWWKRHGLNRASQALFLRSLA